MALPTRVNRGTQSYDPLELAHREFDTVLNRFFGGGYGDVADGGSLAPYGVDVREDADHIYVEAELPGYKKDDVDITLENQTLTITAQKRSEQQTPQQAGGGEGKQAQKGGYLLRERRYSRFQRSFTLPDTVDEQTVNAKLAEGVLTITLNKRPETKPRKIQVS